MTWLTWRQFRTQAIAAAAILAVLAVLLAVTGPHMAHLYDSSGIATCTGFSCQQLSNTFGNELPWFDTVIYLLGLGIMFLAPAIIGVFWGAPVITREIGARTLPLTWNQSVTKTRWLAVKLGLIGLASLATAGLLSLMLTWWSSPIDRATSLNPRHGISLIRVGPALFDVRGITPIAYAAFAFLLGVTAGVLIRRTIPAMATTLAGFAVIQIAMPSWIRPHLIAPAHANVALNPANILGIRDSAVLATPSYTPQGGWILSSQVIDKTGHAFHGALTRACQSGNFQACQASIVRLHLRQLISYQPASRFWTFQWYETTIFLGLIVILAGVCLWRIRRRIS